MTLNDVNNTIAVDHTTDYLYFNGGAMNIVYGEQNYINIIFKHINSRVALSIDATAEMGNVNQYFSKYIRYGICKPQLMAVQHRNICCL